MSPGTEFDLNVSRHIKNTLWINWRVLFEHLRRNA